MVTATIVVFLALFGGAAVLGLMIWLISRKTRGGNSPNNFVGNSGSAPYHNPHNRGDVHYETDDDTDFVDNGYYANESAEVKEQTASDSTANVVNYESTGSESSYSAPPESSYSDSSSYDSGSSSYDSGGSSDSGSSSSSD